VGERADASDGAGGSGGAHASGEPFANAGADVNTLISRGRLADATQLAHAALAQGVSSTVAADLHLALGTIAFMQSRAEVATAAARAVLDTEGATDEQHHAAEVQQLMALLAQGIRRAQPTAQALLGTSQSDATLAGALTAVGALAFIDGRVADSIAFLRAAVRRADRDAPGSHFAHPRQSLAVALTATGAFVEAESLLSHDRDEIVENGDRMWWPAVTIRLGRLYLASGRLGDAASVTQAGIDAAAEVGVSLFVPLGRSTLAAVHVMLGNLPRAAAEVARVRATYEGMDEPFLLALCHWIDARVVASEEGTARAADIMADVYDDPVANFRLFLEEPAIAPWLVRIAIAANHRQRAERVVAAVEALAAGNTEFMSIVAMAVHTRALMDRDSDGLQRAVASFRHPWARALATEHLGQLLARGDRTAARETFERAAHGYDDIGAERDARRVRLALHDLASPRRGRAAAKPIEGWGSLTNAELRVVELVAQGLTNVEVARRMTLSRHTIDFHLRHIFRKLNINSRVALTRLVLQVNEDEDFDD
jgi:DNA-binding CsgD family transcriptional regulator